MVMQNGFATRPLGSDRPKYIRFEQMGMNQGKSLLADNIY
jgi:hypothetical protein